MLDAGRTQPALHYDVELGLARHHHWLRSEAPMPEWADASVATATKSLVPVVIKTFVSVVLMSVLAVAAWHAQTRPQPAAQAIKPPSPGPEPARDVRSSDAWMATAPIPVPVADQDLPGDQTARRAVRMDVPAKRITRVQRHKGLASARAASAPATATAEPDATPGRVEAASPATTRASEDTSVERATEQEVVATHEREPRPEAPPRAQAPDDLAEMQQVATAEHLLERSPERALTMVRQGDQRFARGYFQQERAYIAIMALIRLGRIDEARVRAASFDKQFPALPYGARIRSALEAAP